jgi:hypothetical protein
MRLNLSYKGFKGLMKEWVGKEFVGQLNKKDGMKVIGKLKMMLASELFVEVVGEKAVEKREVGNVKVRSF